MLHVDCGVLSVRQESAEICFIGCNKYTVDKFVHILKTRDEDECGFFQQDRLGDVQPLTLNLLAPTTVGARINP